MINARHRGKKVLLVGGGAREAALASAVSRGGAQLFALMHNANPGIIRLSAGWVQHDENDIDFVASWASSKNVDFAVIGIEDPLGLGVVDVLAEKGIPSVGPSMRASQLEMSKLFTRDLLKRYDIPGQVEYHCFSDIEELEKFILGSDREYALKPIGLTAGKGVKIMGEHLISKETAIAYGSKVINQGIGGFHSVIVEEKLEGEEFTLQSFVDGKTVVPMPAVQDHKRAFEGDTGPNTGGMGSYSQEDGLLPFLARDDYDEAVRILQKVVDALLMEGVEYKGILYGQFMLTKDGLKVIEFNARFGDPEAMNVLCLLQTNFIDVCEAIIGRSLHRQKVQFLDKATVCKYVVPKGYGTNPKEGSILRVDEAGIARRGGSLFYAKVDEKDGDILTTKSRALGLVGVGDSIAEAELIVESCLEFVHGEYDIRHDIGKKELIDKKVRHFREVAR